MRSWLGASIALWAATAAAEPVQARIEAGVIVGEAQDGVAHFQAVPYAAPPVGDLRWAPPKRVKRWSGRRDATKQGPACMQEVFPNRPNRGGVRGAISEDCLHVYVHAPVGAKKAPVLVWIHGGSHMAGAGFVTSGAAFARDGVVVVSINYRLGPFGSFAHPVLTQAAGPTPTGNFGLMDQIAALEWVKRNAAAFGGDPNLVTLAGESAGAASVQFLLATPAAKGLYARAIVQSGGGWFPKETLASREANAVSAEPALGLKSPTVADLRAIPAALALAKVPGPFMPFVDGRLVRETPTEAFARGHVPDRPLLIGSNSGEDVLLGAYRPDMAATIPARIRDVYADEAALGDELLVRAEFTDRVFGAPARWVARKAAAGSPAYLYHFSYVISRFRPVTNRAFHAAEIELVFKDHRATEARHVSDDDRRMAEMLHACWLTFVRVGKPACGDAGDWPAYDAKRDELYEFGAMSGVRTGFRKTRLDAQEAASSLIP